MSGETESLTLKWGSIKGWNCAGNEKMFDAIKRWHDLGVSMSAAMQHDTPEQKQIVCEVIDACNGEIWNDWDGVVMTKDQAKDYVLNYGAKSSSPAA